MVAWACVTYTAVRFLPLAATHSTRPAACTRVIIASTSTASRSPAISVDEIGDHIRWSRSGGRSGMAVGIDGAT
jgi:hypothetical protein